MLSKVFHFGLHVVHLTLRPVTPASPAGDFLCPTASCRREESCQRAGARGSDYTHRFPPFLGSASPRTAHLRSHGTQEKRRGGARPRTPTADRLPRAAAGGRPRDGRPGALQSGGRPRRRPRPAEPQSGHPRAAQSQKQHPARDKGRRTAPRKQRRTLTAGSSPDHGLTATDAPPRPTRGPPGRIGRRACAG